MADINKIGLLVIKNNSFLLCRKGEYTSKLIMPGGGIEPGETDQECLLREVSEELGEGVTLDNIQYIGTYEDMAAADDPSIKRTVEIKLYDADLRGDPVPSSEIVELIWFGPHSDKSELSAIVANKILPDLLAHGKLKWG